MITCTVARDYSRGRDTLKVFGVVPLCMVELKCPECPKTVDSADLQRGSAESALAQHMSQKADHTPESHPEALKLIESGGSDTKAPETTTPESTDSGPKATDHPLLENPVVTDGGEDDEDDEEPDHSCPSCGGSTVKVKEGFAFQGTTTGGQFVEYESDGNGDRYCRSCDVLVDEEGNTVFG